MEYETDPREERFEQSQPMPNQDFDFAGLKLSFEEIIKSEKRDSFQCLESGAGKTSGFCLRLVGYAHVVTLAPGLMMNFFCKSVKDRSILSLTFPLIL